MTSITVVIEDHAEGIHIGQQLAGGRVVEVMQGDHSDLLEALEAVVSISDRKHDAWALAARAAIAKARGN